MAVQPDSFLRIVHLVSEQGSFLNNPALINILFGQVFLQQLFQPLAVACHNLRGQLFQLCHEALQHINPCQQISPDILTLGSTHGHQVAKRLLKGRQQNRLCTSQIHIFLGDFQHIRIAGNLGSCRTSPKPQPVINLIQCLAVGIHQPHVHADGHSLVPQVLKAHIDIQLPPGKILLNLFRQLVFKHIQAVRHVKIRLQIPLVHGFQLHMHLEILIFTIPGTKAGHTLYHE